MRSFVVYLLIKILPERLTSAALAFLVEREGVNVPANHEERACRMETPIYTAPGTTTSAAF